MRKGILGLKVVCFVLLSALFGGGIVSSAAEGTVITVNITGTYGQSGARQMLEMVNAFRTGGEAWCWDETNKNKVPCGSLKALNYDYGLEQTAMQRAAEIALSFSHTRPNGNDCFDITPESWGENIAAGNASVERTFEQWKEEDENYSGQGHRRNMLEPAFGYIGIAHITCNGQNYWVQEFGYDPTGVSESVATDEEKTVAVEVQTSKIKKTSLTSPLDSLSLTYGSSADLPELECKIQIEEAWPEKLSPILVTEPAEKWKVSEGSDFIKIDAETNKILTVNCGDARIQAAMLDQVCTVPVTVMPRDVSEATVDLEKDQYTYTGSKIIPSSIVSLDGKDLKEGTDYQVVVVDNIDVGTAGVDINGCGNYTGQLTKDFQILPRSLNGCTLSVEDQTFTGEAIEAPVTVTLDGVRLDSNKDFSTAYSDNVNTGTAEITVEGRGNYCDKASASFNILQTDIAGCQVDSIGEQTYTGREIRPAVTVSLGSYPLSEGTDFEAGYSNNTDIGEAEITLVGKGNFTGEKQALFKIVPIDLSGCTVEPIPTQTFTGSAVEPQITVRSGNLLLTRDVDFLVDYENNVGVGTAKVVVTGKGNYTGTITKEFEIREQQEQTQPGSDPQTPSTTDPQAPSGSDPQIPSTTDSQTPELPSGSEVQTNSLTAGTVKEDSTSTARYKVKDSVSGEMTVEYVAPSNKKKTSVVIPDTVVIDHVLCKVTSIAANAFKNNKKIKKIVVGSYVTSIGKNAFRGCSKLSTVKIASSVTEIKDSAFSGCKALKSIVIPSQVTRIGKQAFSNCRKLKKITIKSKKLTLKRIGKRAFSGISSKAVIKVPKNKKKAYKQIFRKRGAKSSVKIK